GAPLPDDPQGADAKVPPARVARGPDGAGAGDARAAGVNGRRPRSCPAGARPERSRSRCDHGREAPPRGRSQRRRARSQDGRSGCARRSRAAGACFASMTTVHQVIELVAQLSEEERRVVVDAIAPKESVEELAHAWGEEIARRAARVRADDSKGRPADEVFDRIEAKLRASSRASRS